MGCGLTKALKKSKKSEISVDGAAFLSLGGVMVILRRGCG